MVGQVGSQGDGTLPLFFQTVTLTNAQIKALPTTPVVVVPAPGAGKMILPVARAINKPTFAAPYTNQSAPNTQPYAVLTWGDEVGYASAWMPDDDDPSLGQFSKLFDAAPQVFVLDSYSDTAATWGLVSQAQSFNAENLPVKLFVSNAAGDFTGGHADNVLVVTVVYCVVDL